MGSPDEYLSSIQMYIYFIYIYSVESTCCCRTDFQFYIQNIIYQIYALHNSNNTHVVLFSFVISWLSYGMNRWKCGAYHDKVYALLLSSFYSVVVDAGL